MTTYAVYARFIVEAEDETAAASEVNVRLTEVEGVDEIWIEAEYDEAPIQALESVICPNGHPTGRQNPEYDTGHGLPFATGWFTCEVCGERYQP
jgi:hypothetical protein